LALYGLSLEVRASNIVLVFAKNFLGFPKGLFSIQSSSKGPFREYPFGHFKVFPLGGSSQANLAGYIFPLLLEREKRVVSS